MNASSPTETCRCFVALKSCNSIGEHLVLGIGSSGNCRFGCRERERPALVVSIVSLLVNGEERHTHLAVIPINVDRGREHVDDGTRAL